MTVIALLWVIFAILHLIASVNIDRFALFVTGTQVVLLICGGWLAVGVLTGA